MVFVTLRQYYFKNNRLHNSYHSLFNEIERLSGIKELSSTRSDDTYGSDDGPMLPETIEVGHLQQSTYGKH